MATIQQNNVSHQTINGTNNGDTITLTGSGSDDIVNGKDGSDSIQAGNADQAADYTKVTVNSGNGDDYVSGFGNGSIVNGGAGDDRVFFAYAANVRGYGGSDNDTISSDGPAAMLSGGSGQDTLEIGESSTALGGTQGDVVYVFGGNSLAYGGKGGDLIISYGGANSHLNGGGGADVLFDSNGQANNIFNGNGGNDQLYDFYPYAPDEPSRASTLIGGQGSDQITAHDVGSTMTGGQGNDKFVGEGDTFDSGNAVSITDFVSGQDKVVLSAEGASSSNYSEAKVSGGLSAAMDAAASSGTAYTFVAGDTDGYLIYNDGGNLTGVKIDGANQLADFDRGDIRPNSVVKPAKYG